MVGSQVGSDHAIGSTLMYLILTADPLSFEPFELLGDISTFFGYPYLGAHVLYLSFLKAVKISSDSSKKSFPFSWLTKNFLYNIWNC